MSAEAAAFGLELACLPVVYAATAVAPCI